MKIIMFLYALFIMVLCGCQPQQTRWQAPSPVYRPSAGQLVFEAMSKNIEHHNYCRAERREILSNNKEAFIGKFNNLTQAFAPAGLEQEAVNFIDLIKNNLKEKDLFKLANFIEKFGEFLPDIDLIYLHKILAINDRALEKIILALVHDQDFEKSLENIINMLKAPTLESAELSGNWEIFERSTHNINILDLVEKITKSLKTSNQYKKPLQSALKITHKFQNNQNIRAAALKLNNIISNYEPNCPISQKLIWLKEFKKYPKLAFNLSCNTARFGFWLNSLIQVQELPESLSNFLEKVFADEEAYDLLMSNVNILLSSGILDDILELSDMLNNLYPKANPEDLRIKLIQTLSLDELDSKTLKRIVGLARKFLPRDQPLLQAPVIVVSDVIFQILVSNHPDRCTLEKSQVNYSEYLKRWSEEIVYFINDTKNGLIPMLKTLQSSL